MTECKDCKWWVSPDNPKPKPVYGTCELTKAGYRVGSEKHPESLAHSYDGRVGLLTSSEFGCIQGDLRKSQTFETVVHAIQPAPTEVLAMSGPIIISSANVGDLYVNIPHLDGQVFEDGCEVTVTVKHKRKKAEECEGRWYPCIPQ